MADPHLTIKVDLEPMRAAFATLAAAVERIAKAFAPLIEVHRQNEWATAMLPRGRHGSRVQRARHRAGVRCG